MTSSSRAPAPFADDVRARAGVHGVQLWRRLDYENVIDTERWKEHQTARLDGDREYRRDLYIEQRVTLWSPVDDVREPVHGAADRIAQVLCERDGCFVMVLGPAGTGKTFLVREVARRMAERQQSAITPIVVELRGLDRARDVYELVNWEFARCKQTLPPRLRARPPGGAHRAALRRLRRARHPCPLGSHSRTLRPHSRRSPRPRARDGGQSGGALHLAQRSGRDAHVEGRGARRGGSQGSCRRSRSAASSRRRSSPPTTSPSTSAGRWAALWRDARAWRAFARCTTSPGSRRRRGCSRSSCG